jgi:hypothetical protein
MTKQPLKILMLAAAVLAVGLSVSTPAHADHARRMAFIAAQERLDAERHAEWQRRHEHRHHHGCEFYRDYR